MTESTGTVQPSTINPIVRARGGAEMPALGLGTWHMGTDRARRRDETRALQLGLDLGMTLIDTAEAYGDGGAEEIVGDVIRGRREDVFIVTKVRPLNATREGTIAAAEASLGRLGTDHIDLYLLHTVSPHPHEETLAAFAQLIEQGKIRHYGVSNFDLDHMRAIEADPLGQRITANQLLYNLDRRSLEHELLAWCAEHKVAIMAYSPLDEGRLLGSRALDAVARRHGVAPSAVAIAWTLRHSMVVSIPKAAHSDHVRENVRALELTLSEDDLAELDRAHAKPPPDQFDGWVPYA